MPEIPPERIHNWRQTQLSIARFYGSIKYNGHSYLIAENEPGQPLVRRDVLQRELKAAKAAVRESQRQAKAEAEAKQEKLL